MTKINCEVIRQELDELTLGESCSTSALQHLQNCSACTEFHEKQTKLRRIVGSLGTVEAPADFDFRLRARLAANSNKSVFHYWSFARRGLAVAAVLIVFATGVVLVRNLMNQEVPVNVAVEKNQPAQPQSPQLAESVEPKVQPGSSEVAAELPDAAPRKVRNERPAQAALRNKRQTVAVDFSSQRADILGDAYPVGSSDSSAVFPIDASSQSLKVSLDDGLGNARTISVPTIRFGSQRMLGIGNQFAQKGVW